MIENYFFFQVHVDDQVEKQEGDQSAEYERVLRRGKKPVEVVCRLDEDRLVYDRKDQKGEQKRHAQYEPHFGVSECHRVHQVNEKEHGDKVESEGHEGHYQEVDRDFKAEKDRSFFDMKMGKREIKKPS